MQRSQVTAHGALDFGCPARAALTHPMRPPAAWRSPHSPMYERIESAVILGSQLPGATYMRSNFPSSMSRRMIARRGRGVRPLPRSDRGAASTRFAWIGSGVFPADPTDSAIRQQAGVMVLGMKPANGMMIFNPSPEAMI